MHIIHIHFYLLIKNMHTIIIDTQKYKTWEIWIKTLTYEYTDMLQKI